MEPGGGELRAIDGGNFAADQYGTAILDPNRANPNVIGGQKSPIRDQVGYVEPGVNPDNVLTALPDYPTQILGAPDDKTEILPKPSGEAVQAGDPNLGTVILQKPGEQAIQAGLPSHDATTHIPSGSELGDEFVALKRPVGNLRITGTDLMAPDINVDGGLAPSTINKIGRLNVDMAEPIQGPLTEMPKDVNELMAYSRPIEQIRADWESRLDERRASVADVSLEVPEVTIRSAKDIRRRMEKEKAERPVLGRSAETYVNYKDGTVIKFVHRPKTAKERSEKTPTGASRESSYIAFVHQVEHYQVATEKISPLNKYAPRVTKIYRDREGNIIGFEQPMVHKTVSDFRNHLENGNPMSDIEMVIGALEMAGVTGEEGIAHTQSDLFVRGLERDDWFNYGNVVIAAVSAEDLIDLAAATDSEATRDYYLRLLDLAERNNLNIDFRVPIAIDYAGKDYDPYGTPPDEKMEKYRGIVLIGGTEEYDDPEQIELEAIFMLDQYRKVAASEAEVKRFLGGDLPKGELWNHTSDMDSINTYIRVPGDTAASIIALAQDREFQQRSIGYAER